MNNAEKGKGKKIEETDNSNELELGLDLPKLSPKHRSCTDTPDVMASTSAQHIRTPSSLPLIPIPFLWATDRRATVQSIEYLLENEILNITGDVQCTKCDKKFTLGFNLTEKFSEIWIQFAEEKYKMCDRAPKFWLNPILPKCDYCNKENSVKPVVAEKKKKINWLFMFLGQMLGCCTIGQLKYFCKHNNIHRSAAKDRLLYSTYLHISKQLDPNAPFC